VTAATGAGRPPSSTGGVVPPGGGAATGTFAQAVPSPPVRGAGSEACPLCGAPLDPQQDWCLHCGAAARTRLAATPNWRAPIAAIAVVAALALGVLAAALVKLVGGSDSTATAVTTTITTAPTTATLTTPSTATPGVPGTTTPATPGAVAPGATTSSTSTPTVSPQPSGAGAGGTPTVTAKTRSTPKALHGLNPTQRKRVEELIGVVGKRSAGR
jgi:hypothetical protein